jgi:hypothetical protein
MCWRIIVILSLFVLVVLSRKAIILGLNSTLFSLLFFNVHRDVDIFYNLKGIL